MRDGDPRGVLAVPGGCGDLCGLYRGYARQRHEHHAGGSAGVGHSEVRPRRERPVCADARSSPGEEDEYFNHIAAGEMGAILKDIRERYKKDTTTADTVSPAADAQKQLQEAMSYEGSE